MKKAFLLGVAVGFFCFYIFGKIFVTTHPASDGGVTHSDMASTAAANCPQREPQAIEVPLLPPPEFSKELPEELEASKEGGTVVAWDPVPKALRYDVIVTSPQGTRMNKLKTPFTEVQLRDFRTGDAEESRFLVSIATVNIDGKPGAFGKPKRIIVRDRPDITAPTIKSIKTED